jgi:uncharacterized protein
MSPRSPRGLRGGLTLLAAALAALACERLRLPLPWMIGPLALTAALAVAGVPVLAWDPLRNGGQWAIGTVLGLYFTPQVLALTLALAPVLLLGALWALLLGDLFARFLRWSHTGSQPLHPATAYFSAAIGGASEMALLAERHGGAIEAVAAAHLLRLLLVVLIVPFGLRAAGAQGIDLQPAPPGAVQGLGLLGLAVATGLGAWLMLALRMPNPWVLGPLAVALVLSASGQRWSAFPPGLANAGQLAIGVALGSRFSPDFVRRAPRWLAAVGLGTLAMIVVSAAAAMGLARVAALHPATVVLGTAPGGIAEMAITAAVLHLGVPAVTAFHVVRYVVVLTATGPLYRWRFPRAARR